MQSDDFQRVQSALYSDLVQPLPLVPSSQQSLHLQAVKFLVVQIASLQEQQPALCMKPLYLLALQNFQL